MKDLPAPDDEALLESDQESVATPKKRDQEEELFSTEATGEAEKDQPTETETPQAPQADEDESEDPFDDLFDE